MNNLKEIREGYDICPRCKLDILIYKDSKDSFENCMTCNKCNARFKIVNEIAKTKKIDYNKTLLDLLNTKGYTLELFVKNLLSNTTKREYIEYLQTTCMCGNDLKTDSELTAGVCSECQ